MIRQYSILIVVPLVFLVLSNGQLVEKDPPIKASLCEMYEHPEQYSGKMVEVHAKVGGDFWINDLGEKTCSAFTEVIVVYPKQVSPPPGFDLVLDDSITKLNENIRTGKYVEATFQGRFDVAFVWRDHKKIVVGTRIVLRKVSDVVIRPGYTL